MCGARLVTLIALSCLHLASGLKHLLLIGETGAGKSTLGNLLLGRRAFNTSDGLDSCTADIQWEQGPLFGDSSGPVIQVSDTGGWGDTKGRDEHFVEDMAKHLRTHGGVHGIMYVHNACVTRLGKGAQEAMLRMIHTLADSSQLPSMLQRVAFAFTHCLERRLVYEQELPRQLRAKFNWTGPLPMFWVTSPEPTFLEQVRDKVLGLASGGTWQSKLDSWVRNLPSAPYRLPDTSTHERLKQDFEENRAREIQLQRELAAKVDNLEAAVRRGQEDIKKLEGDLQSRALELERAKAQIAQADSLAEAQRLEAARQAQMEAMRAEQRRLEQELRHARELRDQQAYRYTPSRNGGGGGSWCFAGSSLVEVEGVGALPIRKLQVGHRVATARGWTEVVAWMHNAPGATTREGVALHVAGRVLRLTRDHYVYAGRQGQPTPTPAGDVRPGDALYVGQQRAVANVTDVARVTLTGLHGPLTASGDLLVDGLWASCYVDVGLPHGLVHAITGLWRWPGACNGSL